MSIYDRDYMRDEPSTLGERLRRVSAFHWFFWANIVVFVLQVAFSTSTPESRIHTPGAVSISALTQGHVWTPFTYMFVHGSLGHILMNMLTLWFIGRGVQHLYGSRHFSLLYILGGLAGAALQIVLTGFLAGDKNFELVGASAAVMALLMALAVAMPDQEVILFPIPIRVRMWSVAKFLLIFSLTLGCLDLMHVKVPFFGGNVGHFAHFGGAVAGWYYARLLGYGGIPAAFGMADSFEKPVRRPVTALRRRSLMPKVEMDEDAVNQAAARKDPVADLMQHEVDPILDKINDFGLHSLTDEERRTLERASRQMAKNSGD